MRIWHMTADAGREPLRVAPGQAVRLVIGTSPVELGQSVWVTYNVIHPNGSVDRGFLNAHWDHNAGSSSYWMACLGPFERGDRVTYVVHGSVRDERISLPPVHFTVGPRLYLSLLWHQHQPSYVDLGLPPQGRITQPWVRLHALRAYCAMPALMADFPTLRMTFNLTPSLLWQIEQYVHEGATDRLLDLTRKPVRLLTPQEREAILDLFFEADWQSQIFPFGRYLELFQRRCEQKPFSDQDICDLKMWHNLAWFAPQLQEGTMALPGGQRASVRRFIEQESDFSEEDIEEMVAEQYKVMAAILPLHRELQERGLIEVSTSPFYHPILPLLYDTDTATIDRPGTYKPPRFHYPEDAEAQVAKAVDYYRQHFGRAPVGMWPPEGAVSPEIVPIVARHGFQWMASDQGVLEKSGRWGYEASNPEVLCRPYLVQGDGSELAIFFRETALSNLISFYYHRAYQDMDLAAQDFVRRVIHTVADRLPGQEDRILSIILDGENTWSAYGRQAPAFFSALCRLLAENPEIETVTPAEYLRGDPARGLEAHAAHEQERIYELFTGSWIDEPGSEPGVDLGVWAGEPDENRAWGLLGDARRALANAGVTPRSNPRAFEALYMAEGSDWFWWLGTDRDGARRQEFEALFRLHLRNVYQLAGLQPPPALDWPLTPFGIVWTFIQPLDYVGPREQLVVHANCPGSVEWQLLPSCECGEIPLEPVGGVIRGVYCYQAVLGPFGEGVQEVRLYFRCQEHLVQGGASCVQAERSVRVERTKGQPS